MIAKREGKLTGWKHYFPGVASSLEQAVIPWQFSKQKRVNMDSRCEARVPEWWLWLPTSGLCSFEWASLLGNNGSNWKKSQESSLKAREVHFHRTWKSIGQFVGPLLKPSWGALCPYPPLWDTGAEESGCWGWQMDQCPVLGHFTGKTSPAGCSGREESQLALLRRETLRTVPGAKNNWVGPGARVWGYSTFPVPVQFTPVPQRNSPECILVYTFKFISPSFWRFAFQELL